MSQLARNILYNLAGQLALLVLGFVSARYIFTRLGSDVLGILYFTLTLNTVIAAVLELGITKTTIKEIAANRGDADYVQRLVRSGGFFYWIAYGAAAIAFAALAPVMVARWIEPQVIAPAAATELLRILGVSALLLLPQVFYASTFRGVQRMGVPNAVDVGSSIVQHAGIIALAGRGDIRLVAWWIAAVYVARVGVLAWLVARQFGARALAPRFDLAILRKSRAFAAHMIAISVFAMIHTQADKLLISIVLPVAAIGVYGVVYAMFARGGILVNAVATAAFPRLVELAADRERFATTYRRLHDLMCFGLAPLFALLAFAARPVLGAVLGDAIAPDLVIPAVLLAIGFYLNGTLTIPYYACLAVDRPDIASRQNALALVTTLPVTVVATWQYGLTGAAASWVWYQLFAYAYAIPRVCRECLGIAPAQWFAHVARIAALVAVTYGTAGIAVALVGPSLAALAIAYAAASLGFLVGALRIAAVDSRAAAGEVLRQLLRR